MIRNMKFRNISYFGIRPAYSIRGAFLTHSGPFHSVLKFALRWDGNRAVRLRLFEDPVRRTTAYSTVRWRTTVVMRLEGGCHVGQQISPHYAGNVVNTRSHVIAYDVLDMPRGPLTLPNDHVDPTAHTKRPDVPSGCRLSRKYRTSLHPRPPQ
jgi:hypothetical protein